MSVTVDQLPPLTRGDHKTRADGVCATEAVAWLAGEPHTDRPACVCPVVAVFVRRWNDGLPDDAERDRLIRPLLPAMIGTAGDGHADDRAWMATDWLVRECAPLWLALTPAIAGHADALRALPPVTAATVVRAGAAARAAAGVAEGASAARAATEAAARAAAAWASAAGVAAEAAAEATEGAGARAAFAPTSVALQQSAQGLLRRMCEAGR